MKSYLARVRDKKIRNGYFTLETRFVMWWDNSTPWFSRLCVKLIFHESIIRGCTSEHGDGVSPLLQQHDWYIWTISLLFFNPWLHRYSFWSINNRQLLKTLLVTSNFSFSRSVLYPFGELNTISLNPKFSSVSDNCIPIRPYFWPYIFICIWIGRA